MSGFTTTTFFCICDTVTRISPYGTQTLLSLMRARLTTFPCPDHPPGNWNCWTREAEDGVFCLEPTTPASTNAGDEGVEELHDDVLDDESGA